MTTLSPQPESFMLLLQFLPSSSCLLLLCKTLSLTSCFRIIDGSQNQLPLHRTQAKHQIALEYVVTMAKTGKYKEDDGKSSQSG